MRKERGQEVKKKKRGNAEIKRTLTKEEIELRLTIIQTISSVISALSAIYLILRG